MTETVELGKWTKTVIGPGGDEEQTQYRVVVELDGDRLLAARKDKAVGAAEWEPVEEYGKPEEIIGRRPV